MAGPARHHLAAAEVGVINRSNHVHHRARHPLSRSICGPIYLVRASPNMTIRAVELKGSRHDPHRLQEIVYRNSLKRLDVLEDLFRHKRFLLWRSLRGR